MTQQPELSRSLRRLCAYYEWTPGKERVADELQASADAFDDGTLSHAAAEFIAAVWKPHLGIEAHAGNAPPTFVVADSEDEFQRAILADMRAMAEAAESSAKRIHLRRLLGEQARSFAQRGVIEWGRTG